MKNRIKAILATLKILGYEPDTFLGEKTLVRIKDEKEVVTLNFTNEDLRFCCGVEEIGELDLSVNAKVPEKVVKLFLQYIFLEIKRENTYEGGKPGAKKRRPVLFCGNGKNASFRVEKALRGLKQDYKLVSKSTNPHSGNVISMFVSK